MKCEACVKGQLSGDYKLIRETTYGKIAVKEYECVSCGRKLSKDFTQ